MESRFGKELNPELRSREETDSLLWKLSIQPTPLGIKATRRYNSYFNNTRRAKIKLSIESVWVRFCHSIGVTYTPKRYTSPVHTLRKLADGLNPPVKFKE